MDHAEAVAMLRVVVFDPDVCVDPEETDEMSKLHKLSQTPTSWPRKTGNIPIQMNNVPAAESNKDVASALAELQLVEQDEIPQTQIDQEQPNSLAAQQDHGND